MTGPRAGAAVTADPEGGHHPPQAAGADRLPEHGLPARDQQPAHQPLQTATWRWVFVINLPISALGLLLGARYIPHSRGRTTAALDWPALVGVSTGLPLLLYALTQLSGHPNPLLVGFALAAGAAGLAGFVAGTRRSRHPLIDLSLLRSRVFTAATVASGTTGVLLFGSGLLLPLYFQLGRHDTPVTTSRPACTCWGSPGDRRGPAGDRAARRPPRRRPIATTGAVLALAGASGFAVLPTAADPIAVHALLAVLGAAVALAAVPPGIVAYTAVNAVQLPDATTVINIVQRVGGAFGGALFTLVLAGSGLHTAFWAMAATAALALASTAWLAATAKHAGPSDTGAYH